MPPKKRKEALQLLVEASEQAVQIEKKRVLEQKTHAENTGASKNETKLNE